ncbi:histidine phosphatase family protein [Streptomyces sp. NPDC005047]
MICLTILCPIAGDDTSMSIFAGPEVGKFPRPAASAVAPALSRYSMAVRAPTARCAWTAQALGFDAKVEPALYDFDYGAWQGRTAADLAATEPCGLSEFLTDPDATPHGGESVRRLCRRVSDWLSDMSPRTGEIVVIAEPAIARAALVHALSEPVRAFWHITAPSPATMTLPSKKGPRRSSPSGVTALDKCAAARAEAARAAAGRLRPLMTWPLSRRWRAPGAPVVSQPVTRSRGVAA